MAFFLWTCAHAENVDQIYSASVAVATQQAADRSEGIHKAFSKMLVKVTGQRDIANQAQVQTMRRRANQFVQQYRYELIPDAGQSGAGMTTDERMLWVQFDERAVNQQLRQNGVRIISRNRPSILLWLGLERRGKRQLLQPELESDLLNEIRQVAEDRGMPILLPLMDMEDRAAMQASDLWGGFEGKIRNASDRYAPDVILTGRLLRSSPKRWESDWHFYALDYNESWRSSGQTKTGGIGDGLNHAIDLLMARYAPRQTGNESREILVRIDGLNQLSDYLRLKHYLSSQTLVESAELMQAEPHRVSFLVKVIGSTEALEKSVLLGGLIEPMGDYGGMTGSDVTAPMAFEGETLDYRMRR